MYVIATIGQEDSSIQYTDRPTVKVIIQQDNKILLINDGLLPGGGIDQNESNQDALTRELMEELGVTVKTVREIGMVIQYRNLLDKKYIVYGYTAALETTGGPTNPQDEREAQFTVQWLTLEEALVYVSNSIEKAKLKPLDDASNQGKLYNLMTTFELLKSAR